jgi:hypothetical protein
VQLPSGVRERSRSGVRRLRSRAWPLMQIAIGTPVAWQLATIVLGHPGPLDAA